MRASDDRRRELGAWYTPFELVAHVVEYAVPASVSGQVTILDPACGDGRFLVEAARVVRMRGGEPRLLGVDVDPAALEAARRHPELQGAELTCADALLDPRPWRNERIDVVVGNPPFLSPLASRVLSDQRGRARATTRAAAKGAYADLAVRFLERAVEDVASDGGRVGFVLPISVLASRDAREVRRVVMASCEMHWFWWSVDPMFDAAVTTCAVVLERSVAPRRSDHVLRSVGSEMRASTSIPQPDVDDETWGDLVADALGIPTVGPIRTDGRLGDRARTIADFRDQYYGILEAVVEAVEPTAEIAPLVTTGHIDPGVCFWGMRPVRYGKRRWSSPAVDLTRVDDRTRAWASQRMVPKVMVATQSSVIEAVVDHRGAWLPAVPTISVVPNPDTASTLDEIAAVLTSPVPSALIARRAAGTGLAPRVVRVTARLLASLPWPAGTLTPAVEALRAGRLAECAAHVTAAYGVSPELDAALQEWWDDRRPKGAPVSDARAQTVTPHHRHR